MNVKDEYIKKIEEQMEQWKSEIHTLKSKAEVTETKLENEFHKTVHELEEKLQHAEVKLEELKEVGHDGWEEMKTVYEEVQKEIEDSISHAQMPS